MWLKCRLEDIGCGLWKSEAVSPTTTLLENRERTWIESIWARTRGFLECPGEKGS
jgi:hypothetical protein